MKKITEFGIMDCANIAYRTTLRAANTKDYKLRCKTDRRFKEIAQGLIKDGRGYIIATDVELAAKYPDLVTWKPSDPNPNRKIIWAVDFYPRKRGTQMSFMPIR